MNANRLACLAIGLSLGAAVPALADMDRIGSVDIGFRHDRDVKRFDFGGPVDRLQLRADRSDIDCRSVNATFGNGRTRDVFHGRLREGSTTDIDLPGRDRDIRQLSFHCGARDRSGGTIRIMADVGTHRDEWRRNPNFERMWGRVFNWGSNAVNNWQLVGSEHFEGRNDRENTFAGRRGMHVDAIALKPLDADARCSRITARFANGRSKNLALHNGDLLRRGQYEKLDLPGDTRNLESLSLHCRAADARRVTIQVFTSR